MTFSSNVILANDFPPPNRFFWYFPLIKKHYFARQVLQNMSDSQSKCRRRDIRVQIKSADCLEGLNLYDIRHLHRFFHLPQYAAYHVCSVICLYVWHIWYWPQIRIFSVSHKGVATDSGGCIVRSYWMHSVFTSSISSCWDKGLAFLDWITWRWEACSLFG